MKFRLLYLLEYLLRYFQCEVGQNNFCCSIQIILVPVLCDMLTFSVHDVHMIKITRALWIKNTSESDPHSYEVT